MNEEIKISIIIPVFNVEKYLRVCLDSLINQTLEDIEIICVNDGSTDSSPKILEEYRFKDKRIIVLKKDINLGQGVSRNDGLKQAKGKYLMFVDADDWLEKDACKQAYNAIEKGNYDFVKFAHRIHNMKNGKIYDNFNHILPLIESSNVNNDIRKSGNDFLRAAYIWTQIYNREFIIKNKINFSCLRYGEDLSFYLDVLLKANNYSVLNSILYNYSKNRPNNTTCNIDLFSDLISSRELGIKKIKESNFQNLLTTTYIPYCIRTLVNSFNRIKNNPTKKMKIYNEMKKLFILFKNFELKNNNYKQYKTYILVIKYNYFQYFLFEILSQLKNKLFAFSRNANNEF